MAPRQDTTANMDTPSVLPLDLFQNPPLIMPALSALISSDGTNALIVHHLHHLRSLLYSLMVELENPPAPPVDFTAQAGSGMAVSEQGMTMLEAHAQDQAFYCSEAGEVRGMVADLINRISFLGVERNTLLHGKTKESQGKEAKGNKKGSGSRRPSEASDDGRTSPAPPLTSSSTSTGASSASPLLKVPAPPIKEGKESKEAKEAKNAQSTTLSYRTIPAPPRIPPPSILAFSSLENLLAHLNHMFPSVPATTASTRALTCAALTNSYHTSQEFLTDYWRLTFNNVNLSTLLKTQLNKPMPQMAAREAVYTVTGRLE
ncbi:hypothetical protein TeGR_g493 [Tetraparma gracilis]|nr:hypothetical protein TeGR_g493 [Tetraparma gracilis]